MKYYKMIYDYANDDHFVNCEDGVIGDMDEYLLSSGKYIQDWAGVIFKYDSKEGEVLSDYMANVYRWLVVSKAFCSILDNIVHKNSIQYLSVKLLDVAKNIESNNYQILNILHVIDAIDLENSVYEIFELNDEKIMSVEKYALRSKKIDGHDIFRLMDDTIPVFVSERIKKVIEDNDLLGFAFLEVPVY